MRELTYNDAVNIIYELPKFTVKHTIEESKQFLDMLGHPEKGMRIIHVAGTNGKGSVCAYMESVLMEAGFHTGCFVSPHLVDVRERVRIDGELCSEEDFVEAVWKVRELAEKSFYPSFFEFLFFVGLLIYQKAGVDILILETGLGGRLDATNLIDDKELTVITSIGLDHMEYLGDTLDKIAYEKSGIMRTNTPIVFWDESDSENDDARLVTATINKCAREKSACVKSPRKMIVSDINLGKGGIDFCLRYKYYNDICLTVRSKALYQVYNAALAVYALGVWDTQECISDEAYMSGISKCFWPGRMEEIEPRIILDGAHNVPGIQEFIRSVELDGADKRMLIYGCMADKQYAEEIQLIANSGLFERIVAVTIDYGRALSVSDVASSFAAAGCECEKADDIASAIEMARAYTRDDQGQFVYIAGSLYVIGEVRGLIK